MTKTDARAPLNPLRFGAFRRYLLSRFASGTGLTLMRSTVMWQVYELTGELLPIALVGVAQFVPGLLLSLVGGALADAHDRRRVASAAQGVSAVLTILLSFLTATERLDTPLLCVLVAALAAASAFEAPARAALLPALVPVDVFPRAVVLASAVHTLSFMAGPALAGKLIASYGAPAAYCTHAGLYVAALLWLIDLRVDVARLERRNFSWGSLLEGLSFVWRQPVVLGAMSLDMFAVIFGGATAMLPVYAKDILEVGPVGYGWLAASIELGAVLMAGIIFVRGPVRRPGRTLLVAVGVFAVATIGFGLSRSFPLSIALYVVVGAADYVSVVLRAIAIQMFTPDVMRGRVSGISMIFIGASNQLGLVESSVVAHYTSPTVSVVSGGIAALLVVLIVARFNPALRKY